MGSLTMPRICPRCGAGGHWPDAEACPSCGVALDGPPTSPPSPERCPSCGSSSPVVPGSRCPSCGLRRLVLGASEPPVPLSRPDRRRLPRPERRVALTALAALVGLVAVVTSTRWGSGTEPVAEWRLDLGAEAVGRPVLDRGVAYVATATGQVVAVDLDEGSPRWRFETGERVVAEPLVEGGLLHLATTSSMNEGGHVFTVDARTGEERWRAPTVLPPSGPPAIDAGTLFVIDEGVVALDAVTGEERWRRPLADGGATATAAGGVILVVTGTGLSALDAVTGEERWRWEGAPRPEVVPTIVGDLVLTGDGAGSVAALDLDDGGERWSVATGGLLRHTPEGVGAVLVAATVDGVLRLDSATGERRWRAGPTADQQLRAATDGEVVAVTATDLVLLDADSGARLLRAELEPSRQPAEPAVLGSNVLVATGTSLQLWAVP